MMWSFLAQLYKLFRDWRDENEIDYDTTPVKLGVKLNCLNISGLTKKDTNKGIVRMLNISKLRIHFKIEPTD